MVRWYNEYYGRSLKCSYTESDKRRLINITMMYLDLRGSILVATVEEHVYPFSKKA